MGFFSEDMAPMLGVYEAETSELMAMLDGIITRVEREKAFTHEDIAELFRCAHTVKGSSAMMGLDDLSTLTHRVEDLFDLLRGNPSLAEGRVADIIDRLYAFSDYVKDEIGRMEAPDYAPADADALIRDVAAFASALSQGEGGDSAGDGAGAGGSGADGASGSGAEVGSGDAAFGSAAPASDNAASGSGPDAVPGADPGSGPDPDPDPGPDTDTDTPGVTLKLSFKQDVPMVNARALVIVNQLGKHVRVRSHVPHDLSDVQAARVITDEGLLVVVDASDVEKAKQQLVANSFIRRISVLDDTAGVTDAPAATGAQPADTASSSDRFITLRWDNVQELQDMAGEFLLQASRLKSFCQAQPDDTELRHAVSQMTHLVEDLVYRVDKMAMVNMSAMIPQLSRMVRDMCRDSGKQVSFEVQGGDIEIDRNLYNSISEPLLHIIRNAVDHGIEPPAERLACGKEARGVVTLSVENLGARVVFKVSDDGRGIDTDAVLAKAEARGMLEKPAGSYARSEVLRMVMLAGLSTSDEVTRYSGRGVGMDVVSAVVRDFNGRVEIESELGAGTSMMLFMPVSVTSVECLCFRIGPSVYYMPLLNLSKIFTADEAGAHLSRYEETTLFDFEKRQIPVLDLGPALDCAVNAAFYVVCHSMGDEFVIGVDDILGEYNCSSKPLPLCLGSKWQEGCPIRNVAIMDDGSVGFVLHAAILADMAQGRNQLMDPHYEIGTEDASSSGLLPDAAPITNIPPWAFVFTLGEDRYALSIDQVERLNPLDDCVITPKAPPFFRGLVNYRNQPIAVFDLAKAAGAQGECPYMILVRDAHDGLVGMAISSAVGVRDFSEAVLADEQPDPRVFAGGLRSGMALLLDLKEPPVTLLV